MKEFIDKIKILKETIAELSKSENLSEEQLDQLNKAVVSLREYKAKKSKKEDKAFNEKMRAMGSDIQGQIDQAMREGVPTEGSFEDKPKKKKPNLKLVKALEDAGYRESALLLKNWGEMDTTAKAMEESLEKGQKFQLKPGGKGTQWGTSSHVKEAQEMKAKSKKTPVKEWRFDKEGNRISYEEHADVAAAKKAAKKRVKDK